MPLEAEKVMHSALDRRLSSVSSGGRSTKKTPTAKKKPSSSKQSSKVNIVGQHSPFSRKTSQQMQQRSRRSTFFSSRTNAIHSKSSPLPTIKMKTDVEALTPSSDDDDELLLTYRGWDWDPSSDK